MFSVVGTDRYEMLMPTNINMGPVSVLFLSVASGSVSVTVLTKTRLQVSLLF
jgi:hypothetical protein